MSIAAQTATAPWVDEDLNRAHEIEQIRGIVWSAWRAVNDDMETRLSANENDEAMISALREMCRLMIHVANVQGDTGTVMLLSATIEDLLTLREG